MNVREVARLDHLCNLYILAKTDIEIKNMIIHADNQRRHWKIDSGQDSPKVQSESSSDLDLSDSRDNYR